MFNILIEYPSYDDEINIVKFNTEKSNIDLNQIINAKNLRKYQDLVMSVPIADNVIDFAVNFVHKTRPNHSKASKFMVWKKLLINLG